MDTLVLGGTAFLGRHVAEAFLAAGHTVTCLARGGAAVPEGAALVRADRDLDDALALVDGKAPPLGRGSPEPPGRPARSPARSPRPSATPCSR